MNHARHRGRVVNSYLVLRKKTKQRTLCSVLESLQQAVRWEICLRYVARDLMKLQDKLRSSGQGENTEFLTHLAWSHWALGDQEMSTVRSWWQKGRVFDAITSQDRACPLTHSRLVLCQHRPRKSNHFAKKEKNLVTMQGLVAPWGCSLTPWCDWLSTSQHLLSVSLTSTPLN